MRQLAVQWLTAQVVLYELPLPVGAEAGTSTDVS